MHGKAIHRRRRPTTQLRDRERIDLRETRLGQSPTAVLRW